MPGTIRIFVSTLVAITALLLFIAAVASAILWFHGDQLLAEYKPELERIVGEAMNARVRVGGLRLRVLPRPAAALENLSLTTTAGCGRWDIGRAQLQVRLMPLFQRRIEVELIEMGNFTASAARVDGAYVIADEQGRPCADAPVLAGGPSTADSTSGSFTVVFDLEQLELQNIALRLFRPEGLQRVEINRFTAAVSGNAGILKVGDPVFQGKLNGVPIELESRAFRVQLQPLAMRVNDGVAAIDGQCFAFSGMYEAGRGSLRLSSKKVLLQTIAAAAGRLAAVHLIPAGTKGTAAFSIAADIEEDGRVHVTGEASVLGLRSGHEALTLDEFALHAASFGLEPGKPFTLKGRVALKGLSIADGRERYRAGSVQGPFAISRAQSMSITGDLDVLQFGFSDDETTIDNVDAALSKISVSVNRRGDVSAGVNLGGRSVHLRSPAIEVVSATHVNAPLAVNVPAAGGYEVAGPVSVAGAALILQERRLNNVGGEVRIKVSSPLKEFNADVSGLSAGQPIAVSGRFSMERPLYLLDNTTITVGGGQAVISCRMERGGGRTAGLEVKASNISIVEAWKAFTQKNGTPRGEGRLALFRGDFTASRDSLVQSLRGSGAFRIEDTKFQRYDILKAVKSAVAQISLAGGTSAAPKETPEDSGRDTIQASFQAADQKIAISDLTVSRNNFTVKGALTAGFDGTINGRASAIFLERSFRSLGFGYDSLADVFGAVGKVSIPLLISGTLDKPVVNPDLPRIVKKGSGLGLVESIARGTASAGGKVVEGIFGKKKNPEPTPGAAPAASPIAPGQP